MSGLIERLSDYTPCLNAEQAICHRPTVDEAIAALKPLLALAHQYANDLRYPPTADSIPRRLAAIEAVLVKLEI